MNLDDYQKLALRTERKWDSHNGAIVARALGLCGESGEVAEVLKKFIERDGDGVAVAKRMAEELGDVLWYAAVLAHHLGYNLGTIAEGNINKLRERYPERFTPDGGIRHGEEDAS